MKYCAISRCYDPIQSHNTSYCFNHGQIEEIRLCNRCYNYSIFRRNNMYCYSCSEKYASSSTTILSFLHQSSKPKQTSYINKNKSSPIH